MSVAGALPNWTGIQFKQVNVDTTRYDDVRDTDNR